jgi:hypothetical protein
MSAYQGENGLETDVIAASVGVMKNGNCDVKVYVTTYCFMLQLNDLQTLPNHTQFHWTSSYLKTVTVFTSGTATLKSDDRDFNGWVRVKEACCSSRRVNLNSTDPTKCVNRRSTCECYVCTIIHGTVFDDENRITQGPQLVRQHLAHIRTMPLHRVWSSPQRLHIP